MSGFKIKSISTKLHLPLIGSLILGLVTVSFISYMGLQDIKKEVYENEYHAIQPFLEKNHKAKQTIAYTNILALAHDKVFADALKYGDKEMALKHANEITSYYKKNSKFKAVKIHLHTADVKSFLRSWNPKKNGDDLKSFRETIKEVKRTKKPLSAIEIGRAGLTYRGLTPIFDEEHNYIGSMEYISNFDTLVKSIKKTVKTDVLVLMDKKYLNIATKLKNHPKIGKYVVAQNEKLINKNLIKELQKNNINPSEIKRYITTQNYLLSAKAVKDYSGKVVGYMLTAKNLKLLAKVVDDAEKSTISQLITMAISDTLVLLLLIWIVNKAIKKPLNGLIRAIKELASGSSNLSKRVKVTSDDEIGEIAKNFNRYLDRIEQKQQEEKEFIQKAQKSIQKAKNGTFDETITAKIDSETLTSFKDSVNEMLVAISKNFESINSVLSKYKNNDYTSELKLQNIDKDGDFDKLLKHINGLREVIVGMLKESKENGLTLNGTSNTLLENVNKLNMTSISTKQSLDKANEAIYDMTDNISHNSKNVINMATLAKDVSENAQKGKSLANKTAEAMDEINKEVEEILESIAVIDQIAFQTNILSLNAAVEAATAGDAGKGFAVVASEVRNLASKSADAARLIKDLVENASAKTSSGKEIASQMIEGYNNLNNNIQKTTEYINEIEDASKEQLKAIDKINSTIKEVTTQADESAKVTQKTKEVAIQTDKMAKKSVELVESKKFEEA